MKLSEFKTLLDSLNINVAYSHFDNATEPPYITYYVTNSDNTCADNVVISENLTINVELYTLKKDLTLEQRIRQLFNNNELPYELISEDYIESENVYEVIYETSILACENE